MRRSTVAVLGVGLFAAGWFAGVKVNDLLKHEDCLARGGQWTSIGCELSAGARPTALSSH